MKDNKTLNSCDGKLVIVSSVSGGGKTTLLTLLQKKYPFLIDIITVTTRARRPQEKDGKDYHFYTPVRFSDGIQNNEFLEYAKVYKYYYGVRKESVIPLLEQGKCLLLNIDVQGMQRIKQIIPAEKIISIFIVPPSNKIWEQRLLHRGSDEMTVIQERLRTGKKELQQAMFYDHRIVNEKIENSLEALEKILKENLCI